MTNEQRRTTRQIRGSIDGDYNRRHCDIEATSGVIVFADLHRARSMQERKAVAK